MTIFSFRLLRALLALAAVLPCLAAFPAVAQQGPALAAGYGRVWMLRQYSPSDSLRTPVMYINGAAIGASQPGTIFYRDLPAGAYRFTVDSCTSDVNQAANLNLAPGSQVYLEVQSLSSSMRAWGCLVNEDFYVRQVDPARIQVFLPQLAYLGPR
jgi:hypothetical protein